MGKAMVIIVEGKGTPFVHLTPEAREELCMVYGGDIPYETFSFLAAIFPQQSEKDPIGREKLGQLETVVKFRQAACSKDSMRLLLQSRANYYQGLSEGI